MNKLFVGSLAYETDDASLRSAFSQFGPVTEVKVARKARRSQGYGYVTFLDPRHSAEAIMVMDGSTLDGRRIAVSPLRAARR